MQRFFQRAVAIAASLFVAAIPLAATAGTTGGLSGTVNDEQGRPLANARVLVVSPSDTAAVTTDGRGSFQFLSLPPDTYSLTVTKDGYDTVTESGVTVFADQQQVLTLRTQRRLQTIGSVRTRAASDLVRAGTTADVYSVNASQASAAQLLGGSGNLNTAYSAIASVPGVAVPSGQSGMFQNISIRGGDYEQVGYEFDGVPINKAFDNYPGGALSSLGQQEVQVYTGPPINAEASGSSGFINQVARTGTYPGFKTINVGVGFPQAYQNGQVEFGGSTPSRTFSYYGGFTHYDQDYRYYDQFNGAGQSSIWGQALTTLPCPTSVDPTVLGAYAACYGPGATAAAPNGYLLGPYAAGQVAHIRDTEGLVNLHFGIPHARDAGLRDDVQVLYDTGGVTTSAYNSVNDWGGPDVFLNSGVGLPTLASGLTYAGPLAAPLPPNYASLVSPYAYPSSTQPVGAPIPFDQRDSELTGQSIFKTQSTHAFDAKSYLRVYGYSAYSYRFLYAPFEYTLPFGNAAGEQNIAAPDYEVDTHTSGVSLALADQISSRHLLTLQGSLTTAGSIRSNNGTISNRNRTMAVLVDANDPTSGICYTLAGAPSTCSHAAVVSFKTAAAGAAPVPTGTCGTGSCEFFVAENGYRGSYNAVRPVFIQAALTDAWRPNEKLTIESALRLDSYQYNTADTNTGAARDFWFNAWNQSKCVSTAPASSPVDKTQIGLGVLQPCSAANSSTVSYVPATLYNISAPIYRFAALEPRFGITYTADPNNVLRLSFGKYTQPSATAFAQYNTAQQDLPDFIGPEFYKYGYDQPGHAVPPDTTYNLDASWEHALAGTNVTFKFTPFWRRDFNENQGFYINAAQGFSSGLPIAFSSIRGFELALRKGDFARNGFSAQLSYTYTYSTVNYQTLSNGTTPLTPINNDIRTYNAYTSFCVAHPGDPRCGTTTQNGPAAPCYTPAGVPDPACGAGSVANPYWNAPVQSLFNEGASYLPTDPIVAGVTLQANSYAVPHVASLILNYKHDRFAVTPTFYFSGGQRYGVPESVVGVDPAAGCAALATTPGGDPRYPYGAPGGLAYDATTCGGLLNAVPDPFTSRFDAIGAFVAPSQLVGNVQFRYDVSPHLTVSLGVTNVINQCFGGSKEPWTGFANPKTCSYNSGGLIGTLFPSANVYNPGNVRQPFLYPYIPQFGQYVVNNGYAAPSNPINVFVTAQIKL